MKDYKEIWQDFYDIGVEDYAMSEDRAGKYADEKTADYFARAADDARDRAKERGL